VKAASKRIVIGVTGGIATGKTEVMRLLQKRGIPTIASDELVHTHLRKGTSVYKSVVHSFGRGILSSTHAIDRQRLGDGGVS
jgi:dephospho-CoA kinase